MLGFSLALLATCIIGVFSDGILKPQNKCIDISNDVDNWVSESNTAITTEGGDTLVARNFQTTMRLYLLGIPLPFKVHMEVSDGRLLSMDQFRRISPVFVCSNSTTANYTSGIFGYKDMKMSYTQMKAQFLFWEIEGKFSYAFEPQVNLVIEQSSDPLANNGPLKPLTLTSTGPTAYIIETDNSWKSWFLKKVLQRVLAGDDNTPMLQYFLDKAWVSITCYYCRYGSCF